MKRAIAVCVFITCAAVVIPASPAVASAPKPCLDAIKDAEAIISVNADLAGAVATMFGKNADAADRGARAGTISAVTHFIEEMTANQSELNDATRAATTRVTPLIASFKRNRDKCRRA